MSDDKKPQPIGVRIRQAIIDCLRKIPYPPINDEASRFGCSRRDLLTYVQFVEGIADASDTTIDEWLSELYKAGIVEPLNENLGWWRLAQPALDKLTGRMISMDEQKYFIRIGNSFYPPDLVHHINVGDEYVEVYMKNGGFHSLWVPQELTLADLERIVADLESLSVIVGKLEGGGLRVNHPMLVPSPDDYDHPPDAADHVFALGDRVQTPYGEVDLIVDIREGYRNRADEYVQLSQYRVDSKLPGSPVIWFFGWQLKRVKGDQ